MERTTWRRYMTSDSNVMCMSTNPIIVGRSESVVLNDSIDYELVEKRLKNELGFIDCNANYITRTTVCGDDATILYDVPSKSLIVRFRDAEKVGKYNEKGSSSYICLKRVLNDVGVKLK